MIVRVAIIGFIALLAACGKPAGSPCMIKGSGFTASHDCASKCLSRWQVRCPDGEAIMPRVCAGKKDCEPGSCPDGQVCYHFDDPFEARSYCIPDTVCGRAPGLEQRRHWERASRDKAARSRADWNRKTPTEPTRPASSRTH